MESLLLFLLLAAAVVVRGAIEDDSIKLPEVLFDQQSPLADSAAMTLKQEIERTGFLPPYLCNGAGFATDCSITPQDDTHDHNAAGIQFPAATDASGKQFPAILYSKDASGNQFPAILYSKDASGNQFPAILYDQAGNQFPAILYDQAGNQFPAILYSKDASGNHQFPAILYDQAGNQFPAILYSKDASSGNQFPAILYSKDASGNQFPAILYSSDVSSSNQFPAILYSSDASGNQFPAILYSSDASSSNQFPAILYSKDASGSQFPAILYSSDVSSSNQFPAILYSKDASGSQFPAILYSSDVSSSNQFPAILYGSHKVSSGNQFPKASEDSTSRRALAGVITKYEMSLFFKPPAVEAGAVLTMPPMDQKFPKTKFLHPLLAPIFEGMSVPRLLSTLRIPNTSHEAATIGEGSYACSQKALPRETRGCHASIKSMLSLVKLALKPRIESCKKQSASADCSVKSLAVELPDESPLRDSFRSVKILNTEVVANKSDVVVCHPVLFAYSVYMCHAIPNNAAYKVTVQDTEDGSKLVIPAVCHFDTSMFNPGFISFKVLGGKPGDTVCHWLATNSIIWHV